MAVETLLQRYLAGEHRQVWAELVALGALEPGGQPHAAALAVARETMRRAQVNIGLLVGRLKSADFKFGPFWWEAPTYKESQADPTWRERYPAVFALPKPNVHEQLAELEARVGRIPLSLYAWFETVGSVNLVGSYPVEDPRDPEGFNNWAQYRRADPAEERLREYEDSSRWTDLHDLDPLFVYPIERALRRTTYVLSSTGQRLSSIEIAPDEQAKYELGGEDNYRIQVPDATADACLEGEWHETTFVDYLRICFRWGGFPGLHSRTRIPTHELAYLTRDLLPV